MKRFALISILLSACMMGFAQGCLDPLLSQEMDRRSDGEQIEVVVLMKAQYDRSQLSRRADYFPSRAERRTFVVNELKAFAEASQYDLKRVLSEMERQQIVTTPNVLWMSNALYFKATKAAILDLASRNDIALISLNQKHYCLGDTAMEPAPATREITSNVLRVRANEVWALGYRGQGVVVAVIDTGVNYEHVDLADHLWEGGSEFPHHGYDVYNHDNDPMDDMGHGTHCAGTVCGDGTAGSQTGVAPDATLMCVKCLDEYGGGSAASIAAGIEWAVEHGCDLFSLSLGIPNSTIAERTLLRHTCDAVLDAGIVGTVSAGNDGNTGMYPVPNNVGVPGSCPPPYMDPVQMENPGELSCTITVGAVDNSDNPANFTSRGPVTWANTEFGDYPYNPGMGLIRPDLCAPGVSVKSLHFGLSPAYNTMSGTSQATPAVAGTIALMLCKCDFLTPAEICRILEETAVPLSETKSNVTGFGRIDALAAVEAVVAGPLSLVSCQINDPQGNNDHQINPGESATIDLTLLNDTGETLNNLTAQLSTRSDKVAITSDVAQLPSFGPHQTLTIENAFAFEVSEDAIGNEDLRFTCDVYDGDMLTGRFSLNFKVFGYVLNIAEITALNDDNGNGLLEPGETADLRVIVENIGNLPASSLVGTFSSDCEFLSIHETQKPFGTIEESGENYADFRVSLSADAPANGMIPLKLTLVDEGGKQTWLGYDYKTTCNIVFTLRDAWGDGWHGSYLSVNYGDGTTPEQMTISSGTSLTHTREVTTNSQITLTWHSTGFDWDVSFEVAYEDGDVIYQNQGGMSSPFSFVANCMGSGYVEVAEGFSESEASIFPNPSHDSFTIVCEGMRRVEVFSIDGKLLKTIQVNTPQCQLDGLESGVYFVRIEAENSVIVNKIVKL